jgi:hypothetical protein
MATPFSRRPQPADEPSRTVAIAPDEGEYQLPASRRGMAAQAAAALGILAGLWVALSPLFIVLQHGGGLNAAAADVIAGLVAAGFGVFALASRRGFPGLQFASAVLGVWVLISSFILDARVSIAAPMYWSNTFTGVLLVLLALAGLAAVRRGTRVTR